MKADPEQWDHEELSMGPVLQNWQAVLAVNFITHLHLHWLDLSESEGSPDKHT